MTSSEEKKEPGVCPPKQKKHNSTPKKVSSQNAGNSASEEGHHLPSLNVLQLVGITYFSACGGPFGFEEAIGAGGGALALLGIFIMPFIWSIPLALMTAELSTLIPESGGHIVWIDRGLGPFFGCLNCVFSAFTNAFDNALYPVMFCDYLEEALFAYTQSDFSDTTSFMLRLSIVLLTCALNIRGADIVGAASVIFGFLVISPFVVMMCFGLGPLLKDWDGLPGEKFLSNADRHYRLGAFTSVMLWNTAGFDNAGTCAAEVANPGTTYPRALAISILLVVLTYAGPTLVGIYYIPDMDEWEDGVFVDVGEEVAGPWLRNWLGMAGVVSSLGLLCTLSCTSSRMIEGMANIGQLPKFCGALHSKYGTPYVGIIINGITTLALSHLPFSALAEVDMLFYNLSTVLKFVVLIKFRTSMADIPRPYRIPLGYRGLCLYFSPPIVLCVAAIALFSWSSILTGLVVLVVTSVGFWTRRLVQGPSFSSLFSNIKPPWLRRVTSWKRTKNSDICLPNLPNTEVHAKRPLLDRSHD